MNLEKKFELKMEFEKTFPLVKFAFISFKKHRVAHYNVLISHIRKFKDTRISKHFHNIIVLVVVGLDII